MVRKQRRNLSQWLVGLICCVVITAEAQAQQIAVSSPFTNVSDSFYENHGVNFGFSLPGGRGPGSRVVGYAGNGVLTPNIHFRQGGSGAAIPPFGNFDPNSQAHFGFARINPGGGGFNLGLTLGKGNSRTLTSTTPTVVVPNGFGGSIFDGSFVPFVTSVTPVSGNMIDNGVTRAIQSGQLDLTSPSKEPAYVPTGSVKHTDSSAKYGDASVSSIKAQREARLKAKLQQVQDWIDQGLAHEEKNEFREARRVYRRAINNCDDKKQLKWLRDRVSFLRGR